VVAQIVNARLPDDLFLNQKSQFGEILDGIAMEDVGIFYATFWSVLRPIGKFDWYISPVLVCCTKKNLATLRE
jgi:hypothetical protein